MISIVEFLVKTNKSQNPKIKLIKSFDDIESGDYFACEWTLPYTKNKVHAYAKCLNKDNDLVSTEIQVVERYSNSGNPEYSDRTNKDGWPITMDSYMTKDEDKTYKSINDNELKAFEEIESHIKKSGKKSFIGVIDKDKKIVRWV